MATHGEFIDRVRTAEAIDAKVFLNRLTKLTTEAQWAEYRKMPLTSGLVYGLASDVANYFAEALAHTGEADLYAMTREDGHSFLRDIHRHATELGVEVDLKDIDISLTPSDALITVGYARIIDKGSDA